MTVFLHEYDYEHMNDMLECCVQIIQYIDNEQAVHLNNFSWRQ